MQMEILHTNFKNILESNTWCIIGAQLMGGNTVAAVTTPITVGTMFPSFNILKGVRTHGRQHPWPHLMQL